MPEAPCCVTTAEQLNKVLQGSQIDLIEVIGGRYLKEQIKQIDQLQFPLSVSRIYCKGKLITFLFQDATQKSVWLFSTLGMTGHWILKPTTKHIAMRLQYSINGEDGDIYYCDQRRFGTLMFEHSPLLAQKRLDTIAPGFLGEVLITKEQFLANLAKHSSKYLIKALMDQHSIASSIGNYLASEIFYACKFHPEVICKDLSEENTLTLFNECYRIVNESYSYGGVSVRDYIHVFGTKGTYQDHLKVYDQKKDPLGNTVIKNKGQHGRTIHWVEEIQTIR